MHRANQYAVRLAPSVAVEKGTDCPRCQKPVHPDRWGNLHQSWQMDADAEGRLRRVDPGEWVCWSCWDRQADKNRRALDGK